LPPDDAPRLASSASKSGFALFAMVPTKIAARGRSAERGDVAHDAIHQPTDRVECGHALSLHNLLEPQGLIGHFKNHPPEGFSSLALASVPAFSADFDLLTTLEPRFRQRVAWLAHFFRSRTCFIGTTVTEYALLPEDVEPDTLLREVLMPLVAQFAFVIVKDIPTEATLVGEDAQTYSARLLDASRRAGFVAVDGQALAYVPIDFTSVDDYLSRLSHARRKNIRRKLRSADALHIGEIRTGDPRLQDDGFIAMFYAMYENVYAQSDIHFDKLTPEFFRSVLQDPLIDGIIFTYRAGDTLVGFNLCLAANGILIDKYIGFVYPEARQHNLYAVSWFHNLEHALAGGFRYYVAGWTDPEVKRELGAQFTFTVHAVHVRNRILRMFLRAFRRLFESDRTWESFNAAHGRS
jgi:hypothetical protein